MPGTETVSLCTNTKKKGLQIMSLVAYASKTKQNEHLPNLVNAGWLERIN